MALNDIVTIRGTEESFVVKQESTLLVVDDEPANLESLERIFRKEGYRVLGESTANGALEACRRNRVQIVLTDLQMPGMTGIDLVKALALVSPDTDVVVMTAYGTIETAVSAMREGAYDFVSKPLKRMQIVKTIQKATEHQSLLTENRTLKRELSVLKNRSIVGSAPALRHALDIATQAAPSSANVLVLGDSGTGKELLARFIHEHSGRSGAFVGVNLAALPETIVESELFGHEKGAFTGAIASRAGRIGQAEGGTLFLDEIGELSSAVQVKLLRVLQEGEYEPVGGKTKRADFRLIAATNHDLHAAVKANEFREDLFYRLNVIAITSPRLANRRDDIPLLAEHFLELYCQKNGRDRMSLSPEALEKLAAYDWPGNVRELENVIERAVVLGHGVLITPSDLPQPIVDAKAHSDSLTFSIGTSLNDIERSVIRATLTQAKGDKQLAARLLGISARTIYRKLGEPE